MSTQTLDSQSTGNGDVSSNHVISGLSPDDIISDDEDVAMEEEQPQLRAGVFSKFRSVCQNVFQSLIGGKQQQRVDKANENTTRIIRRRSRQTLVPAEMQRKASELSVFNSMHSGNLPTTSHLNSNQLPVGSVLSSNGRPSTHNLLATAAAVNANSMEIGSRLAVPVKRSFTEAQPTSLAAMTPFKGDVANQSFTAPWSALKQRRLEETSIRPAETSTFIQPPVANIRAAPIIETTSLQQTIRESDRYSSMTLPSSHLHRPASRDFGSALSGETSSLTTPLGAKRRVSLFETKTMTPHFNVEKMEPVPYHTLDRFPARSSPLVGLASPRPQSPLAPRVVRLDVSTSKPSPHSPLVRAHLSSVPTVVNPTAQRLAKAYQQLTSATVTKPQMNQVDPTRVHLIDPAQFFTRSKTEVIEAPPKVEPITVKPVEPQISVTVQQQHVPKPAFRFAPSTLASHEPIDTGKVVTNGGQQLGKFSLTAPSVLLDGNVGSVAAIWTCSDCDIANSITNDYCFSCGRSKLSSSKVEATEVKTTEQQPDVAVKRQRQTVEPPKAASALFAPSTVETNRISSGGPSATSTPFVMSASMTKKVDEQPSKPSAPTPVAGGVVGQWRCSNCLFMNDFKAISCGRCSRSSTSAPPVVPVNGMATTSAATSQVASTTPAAGASSRLKRRATLEGGWVCGCQHTNPRSATVCDLCNAPKPQISLPPPLTSSISVPTVPKTTASEPAVAFKPINGLPEAKIQLPPISLPITTESVRLTTATATTTSLTAPIPTPAPILSEPKPSATSTAAPSTSTTATLAAPLSSTGFGSQFSAKEGQWTCDVCMIRNDKDKVKCAACDSPNPNAPKTAAQPNEQPKFGILPAAPSSGTGFSFGFGAVPTATTKSTEPPTPSTVAFGIPPTTTTTTTPAPPPAMGGFKFGVSTSPVTAATTAPVSTTTVPSFAFGSLAKQPTTTTAAPAPPGGFAFTFGASSAQTTAATTTTSSAPAPVFGASAFAPTTTTAATMQAPSFFGASTAPTTTASVFGMPPTTTSAPSMFGSPASTTSIPSFAGTFGAPQSTQAGSTGFFGTTNSTTSAPLFGSTTTTTTSAGTTAPLFAFGGSATAPTPATTSAPSSGGFTFGSAPSTAQPSGGFVFGSAPVPVAPATTTVPSSGFAFGSSVSTTPATAAATTTAPSTAPMFAFGSTSSTTAPASFAFGSTAAAAQPTSTSAAPQTNGPSLFAFGGNAPTTTTGTTFGQNAPSSTSFTFGALAPQPATVSTAASTAPAFNFASSVPSFGSTTTANSAGTTNGTSGGFKFEASAPAFNFTSGNPPAGPVTTTPQPPAFVFNSGGSFSPAQTAPGADGPLLFSSGAAVGQNRPKAAAVRKLKVAGRK